MLKYKKLVLFVVAALFAGTHHPADLASGRVAAKRRLEPSTGKLLALEQRGAWGKSLKSCAKYGFFVCILGLAAALLPLSGCGGGGSDNTGSSNNPPPTSSNPDLAPDSTPPSLGNASEVAQNEGGQGAIAKASQNSPKAGSVTQSSNAGSDGVTTDSVSVEARRVGDKVQYRVRNSNAGWSVDSREDTVLDRVGGEDWDGVELKKRLSGADLYVDVYAGPKPPSDHLAGGLWVYVPDSATNVDDFVFGAFVDGNDPFEQSELSALTGVVTYEGEGDVTLVYSDADPTARQNYFPDASVTLKVDFDNETVSGTIHSFNADGEPVNLNVAELTLEEANIGDSNSGFFSGDTRGTTPKGVNGEGKWGGQFSFGNGDGAPEGVAGTFGFTTNNGEESVLGVFGASRSSESGSPPGFAPADQAAFNDLVVGKRVLSPDPLYYTDFPSPGRFRETEDGDIYTGRYTYENKGPNSATVEFRYDDGDRCTSELTFNSATTGNLTYSCNDGDTGTSNWRIEDTPSAPVDVPDNSGPAADCGVGAILSAGDSCSYEVSGSTYVFTVQSDGSSCFTSGGLNFCAGTGHTYRGVNLNGITITFVAEKRADGRWEIKELSDNIVPVDN